MNEDLLDKISTIAFTNLYSISKKTKRIELIGFDSKNIEHMALLALAQNAYTVFGFNLFIEMPLIKFLWFKFQHRKKFKIKRLKQVMNKFAPSCNEFIYHIYENNEGSEGVFKKIYERYYIK